VRAVLRFAASVMIVSGVLLISDAAATLLWQEPVSALLAQRQQARLEDALANPPPRVVRKEPLPGDAIGKIEIPAIGVSRFVVEGTSLGDLRKGPGHYRDTPMPGDRGTVAIAGHRTTYGAPFRHVDDVRPGNRIVLEMPYGRYRYRVERTQIVGADALWVKRRRPYDRLVLSACHPLHSAAQRIVVFARLVGEDRDTSVTRPP
jgi:sortase A